MTKLSKKSKKEKGNVSVSKDKLTEKKGAPATLKGNTPKKGSENKNVDR